MVDYIGEIRIQVREHLSKKGKQTWGYKAQAARKEESSCFKEIKVSIFGTRFIAHTRHQSN